MAAKNLMAEFQQYELSDQRHLLRIERILKNIRSIRRESMKLVGLARWAFLEASDYYEYTALSLSVLNDPKNLLSTDWKHKKLDSIEYQLIYNTKSVADLLILPDR